MVGTGYFPLGREQSYEMSNEDPPKYLVGTAEVPLLLRCAPDHYG